MLLANRALVLARMREFPEARALVDKAAGLAPWWTHVATVRVQVAMLAGDPGAQRLVDELLRMDPENEIAHALQGNLAVKNSRFIEASRAFDEVARLAPTDVDLVGTAREARWVSRRIHFSRRCGRTSLRVGWFPAKVVLLVASSVGLNAAGYHTLAERGDRRLVRVDRVLPDRAPVSSPANEEAIRWLLSGPRLFAGHSS